MFLLKTKFTTVDDLQTYTVPMNAMKAYRYEYRGVAPFIPRSQPPIQWVPRYPLNTRLGASQRRYERYGEEKNPYP